MAKTSRRTWQKSEGRNAAFFGAKRNSLSGRGSKMSASDSTHPELFIESKLRQKCAVRSLWRKTKKLADEEKKIPVLMLCEKNKPGALICVHIDDFDAVAAARQEALAQKEKECQARSTSFIETPASPRS